MPAANSIAKRKSFSCFRLTVMTCAMNASPQAAAVRDEGTTPLRRYYPQYRMRSTRAHLTMRSAAQTVGGTDGGKDESSASRTGQEGFDPAAQAHRRANA